MNISLVLKRAIPALVLGVVGCANLPADRGAGAVQGLLSARDAAWTQVSVFSTAPSAELDRQLEQLLAAPLTPERALSVALLRNPAVQSQYARLGLAQADWLEASRLSNPVLSWSLLESNAAGQGSRLGFGLVQNFGEILFVRSRGRVADQVIAARQGEVAAALQQLASDVATRYFEWIGAAQRAQMRSLRARAADASAELARRFHAAGNLDALELAREQAAGQQAWLDAEAADAAKEAARIRLSAVMGLDPLAVWSAPSALPLPVEDELALPALIEQGLEGHLTLKAAQREVAALEATETLAQRLRWLPFLAVGVESEREPDGTRLLGPTVSVALPLFGASRGQLLRTQALLDQARANQRTRANELAGAIGTAYAQLRAAQARVARYRDGLIPQREAIVARTQERQNYMVVGPFELLLAKQQEYAAYEGYLESLCDYWLARIALARALGTALPGDGRIGVAEIGAVILPAAASPSPHAHHHDAAQPAPAGAVPADPSPAPDPHAGHTSPEPQHHHGDH